MSPTPNYRAHGFRQRTFTYAYCGRTEVDYVCRRCETIVLNLATGCQYCAAKTAKQEEQFAVFLAAKKGAP